MSREAGTKRLKARKRISNYGMQSSISLNHQRTAKEDLNCFGTKNENNRYTDKD